jgi:hypothetical protein
MSYYLTNLAAIAAILFAAAGFETGALATGDAFFLALAGVVLYTGSQLMHRNGQALSRALRAIFSEPESYPTRRVGQVVYGAAMMAGLGVLMRTLLSS